MSDVSPPPKYDPTWTNPQHHVTVTHQHRKHVLPTANPTSGGTSTTSCADRGAPHFHPRVPLLSTTDDDDEDDEEDDDANDIDDDGEPLFGIDDGIITGTASSRAGGRGSGDGAGDDGCREASPSQGLLSFHSALSSSYPPTPTPTPPSPVPLILLPNGEAASFYRHGYQLEQLAAPGHTSSPPGIGPTASAPTVGTPTPPGGSRRSSSARRHSSLTPVEELAAFPPPRAVSASASIGSTSSSDAAATATAGQEEDENGADDDEGADFCSAGNSDTRLNESSETLSSPPSYPDSPPSYPDSPPSYPHSPPEYPAAAAAVAAAAVNVVVPGGYSGEDGRGAYLHCVLPPPREVPCLIMASPIPPSTSGYGITVEPAGCGSHSSLSQPLGSGHSLTQPSAATANNNNNSGGDGSRSSLGHPVVVRTGSRNSLTHQPLGSKHSLSLGNPGISRKSMTRHSFHHPPQPAGRVTASQLMRTASTHAPRSSPLHRDHSGGVGGGTTNNSSTRSKGSACSNSNRSLSPSMPFYPHNQPGTRSLSWNDLDPTAATSGSTDNNQVTLILQDINPDSTAIYLTHVNHPSTSQLIDPSDLEQILLAEGQRDIDQFESPEDSKKRRMKLRNVCLVFWSLTCHVGFFVCIALLVWQVMLKRQSELQHQIWAKRPAEEQGESPTPLHSNPLLIIASVMLVVCYVFSWVESCVSDTHRYIDHKMELTKCRMYVRRMRVTVPKLRWSIDCYHWSSEDPVVRNSGEKAQHEKVMTHTEVEEFPFSICKDASGDLGTFKKSAINRFEFEKTFGFVDQATADAYEQRKEAFMQRNMYMDRHYSFKEVFELEGMESHMTVYVERGHLTKLMSFQLYSCLACCLLTWPYRILFRCFTKKRKFTFVKLLQL